ncbi:MAG TPA: hypothetical protein VGJ92_00700 [Methanocella sp.]
MRTYITAIAALALLFTISMQAGASFSPGIYAQSSGFYPASGGTYLGCPGCPGCPDNPERQPGAPGCYGLGCPGCPGCPDGNVTPVNPGDPGCMACGYR